VLEIGIGTGRLALPLAAMGVEVHGIEASEEMVAVLRTKPCGAQMPVAIGDFCTTQVPGEFSVVLVLYSTLFLVTTQEEQLQCFENAARHLRPGGLFVVEGFVHDRTRFAKGQCVSVRDLDTEGVILLASRHDAVRQLLELQRIVFSSERVQIRPNRLRYIWPTEMDMMARVAGFHLRDRWADWQGGRFTADSEEFISIYEKA
jgi:SAM-dependent methyltransferase